MAGLGSSLVLESTTLRPVALDFLFSIRSEVDFFIFSSKLLPVPPVPDPDFLDSSVCWMAIETKMEKNMP